ncbi:MAG TPA: hypothetical protein VEW66_00575, partial [Thermomicrobiales bacterium]|nr:hypothetical protein [Thermomicrobiales bacterium]
RPAGMQLAEVVGQTVRTTESAIGGGEQRAHADSGPPLPRMPDVFAEKGASQQGRHGVDPYRRFGSIDEFGLAEGDRRCGIQRPGGQQNR